MTETTQAVRGASLPLDDQRQLQLLRAHRRAHRQKLLGRPLAAPEHFLPAAATRGQRLADAVAVTIGSWRFIIFQSSAIVLWITGNVLT
jgi:uncharacterized membrane protein